MKRKSANELDLHQPLRTAKKTRSCLLNPKSFHRGSKDNRLWRAHVSGEVVVDILMGELMENLQQKFKESDQRRFHQMLLDTVDVAALALESMLNPIKQFARNSIIPEAEPKNAVADLLCGGNSITCEGKPARPTRISIAEGIQVGEHRRDKSQFNPYSNPNISTKCLIKLPKQQLHQRRLGLEALKEGVQKRDVLEQLLRDKIAKDKKNLYFNQQKLQGITKQAGLPSIEQYTFDYDGSLFPIKKNSIKSTHRIKVLNTTCRVLGRELIQNRKQSMLGKVHHGSYLKTEATQVQKENNREGLKRNLSQRKQPNTDSARELLRICTETDETTLKMKIQESVGNKFVKIRELKAH